MRTTHVRSAFFALCALWCTAGAALAQNPAANSAVIPVPRDASWLKLHEAINARSRQGDVDLVFLGDSITQGWNWNENDAVWKKYYGHRRALNAGIGGDQTQHLLWRLQHGNLDGIHPRLAVLMIGTNNPHPPEQTAEGIKAILAHLREKRPTTRVLLLAVFPRGDKTSPWRAHNARVSTLASSVADGKMIHYLDIGPAFLADDGSLSRDIMPDLIHLSLKGYQIWAAAIEAKVAALLEDQPVE